MHWRRLLTGEVFDAVAQATLDHIFAPPEKSRVYLARTYVDFGQISVTCYVPYADGCGVFEVFCNARADSTDKDVHYNVPPFGPFAGVGAPLAHGIALELFLFFLHRLHISLSLQDAGEYEATFAPLVKQMCVETPWMNKLDVADCKARVLTAAERAVVHTSASAGQRAVICTLAAHTRRAKWRRRVAYTAHVLHGLVRWERRCLERLYAPGGAGFEAARHEFGSIAHCGGM